MRREGRGWGKFFGARIRSCRWCWGVAATQPVDAGQLRRGRATCERWRSASTMKMMSSTTSNTSATGSPTPCCTSCRPQPGTYVNSEAVGYRKINSSILCSLYYISANNGETNSYTLYKWGTKSSFCEDQPRCVVPAVKQNRWLGLQLQKL